MTPGPKPKPGELAEKQGNPGHRPVVKASEDAAPAIEASIPEWLDETGAAIWATYMPRLKAMAYVRETDRLAFARLCDHTARWMRLRMKVNDRGESYTTESRHGKMDRINPDFAAMLRVEEKMLALEDRFGLTPAARQSILARLTDPPSAPSELPFGTTPHTSQQPSSPIGLLAPAPASKSSETLN
jgi:P27 family predicted phage terminase small subunit